jgi:hypothetical protein
LFFKRALFNTKRRDDLRTTIITSAARIKTEEAFSLIKSGLNDRSKSIRETSEIVLKLDA